MPRSRRATGLARRTAGFDDCPTARSREKIPGEDRLIGSPRANERLRLLVSSVRPRGFEPLTFGFLGGASTCPVTPVPTRNCLHRRISRSDTSGHERPWDDAIGSHLVPTRVPTDARRGRPERGSSARPGGDRLATADGHSAGTLSSWQLRVARSRPNSTRGSSLARAQTRDASASSSSSARSSSRRSPASSPARSSSAASRQTRWPTSSTCCAATLSFTRIRRLSSALPATRTTTASWRWRRPRSGAGLERPRRARRRHRRPRGAQRSRLSPPTRLTPRSDSRRCVRDGVFALAAAARSLSGRSAERPTLASEVFTSGSTCGLGREDFGCIGRLVITSWPEQ
jgi:hypothetical protein